MILATWGNVLSLSFQDLWLGVVSYVPNLIIAIVILIAGWVVGSFLGNIVEQIFKQIKVDDALRSAGVETVVTNAGLKLNSGAFIGTLVKWFIVLAFLTASFDVLGLKSVTDFLRYIALTEVPQIIVAILVLMASVIVAEVIQKLITASARAAGVKAANLLGTLAKWAIWIFAIIVALSQVGIANDLLLTFFQGVVVALALGFGLAFGLGGQDAARDYIKKVQSEITTHDKKMM